MVLSIAGSDSGGGAGIQADIRTLTALGAFAATAITALTAQNTLGVQAVSTVAPGFVERQIASVVADLAVASVKTGALVTAATIAVVASHARAGRLPNLVLDPVMVATSGDSLIEPQAEEAYLTDLLPHARVITPNLPEAARLLGRPVETLADMREAAEALGERGASCAVIKGGHLADLDGERDSVDVVLVGGRIRELRGARVPTGNTHGTGCALSAAIAAGLAHGLDDWESIVAARRYLTAALEAGAGWDIGAGAGPVGHTLGGEWRG